MFYENLITYSLDFLILINEEGVIEFATPSISEIFGYAPEEITGNKTFDIVHPDDISQSYLAFQAEVSGGIKNNYQEPRNLNASGQWVWMSLRAHNLLSNPIFKSMVIYSSDIAEHRKLSQQLIDQEIQKQKLLTEATITGQEK